VSVDGVCATAGDATDTARTNAKTVAIAFGMVFLRPPLILQGNNDDGTVVFHEAKMAGQDAAIQGSRQSYPCRASWTLGFHSMTISNLTKRSGASKTNKATRDDAPTSLCNDRHSSLRFGTRASFRRPIAPLRARSKQTRVLFGWLHASCELCRPRMANVERTHLEFMADGSAREDRNANREKSASAAGRGHYICCGDIARPQRRADIARGISLRLSALDKVRCRDRCFLAAAQAPERSSAPR
jgi:hypothetical protein